MEYKVVPFVANIGPKQGVEVGAGQLEYLISQMVGQGFDYVRLESVETVVQGNAGCFGIGATPAVVKSFTMAVFKR
jgi:hypothetical protein